MDDLLQSSCIPCEEPEELLPKLDDQLEDLCPPCDDTVEEIHILPKADIVEVIITGVKQDDLVTLFHQRRCRI